MPTSASPSLRCSRCRQIKPKSHFYRRSARARGYSSECKPCYKAQPRYRDAEKRRDETLRRRYGISAQDYDLLLAGQGGVCALCGNEAYGRARLHVDHDHETGDVRGLLCFHCNTALGRLERLGMDRLLVYITEERMPV